MINDKTLPVSPFLSLIVPVFNETPSLEIFFSQLLKVIENYKGKLEIIIVNDGSTDDTKTTVLSYIEKFPFIKLISFSRNFGKEAAITAGVDHSAGDVVIPIDVDLQDPPELILKMIDKWAEGYDIVYARRSRRNSDSFIKRNSAECFYRIFNWIADIHMPSNVGDFRLMDRKVINALKLLPERNRFNKGLFAWVGFSSATISYERKGRAEGKSRWSLWKLWNFALDGIFSFSMVPLRVWSYLGAFVAVFAFFYIGFLLIRVVLFGIDVPGYASLMTVVLFFGGIQLLSIGILGEYIGRIFIETKSRPIYIIESIFTSPGNTSDLKPSELMLDKYGS